MHLLKGLKINIVRKGTEESNKQGI